MDSSGQIVTAKCQGRVHQRSSALYGAEAIQRVLAGRSKFQRDRHRGPWHAHDDTADYRLTVGASLIDPAGEVAPARGIARPIDPLFRSVALAGFAMTVGTALGLEKLRSVAQGLGRVWRLRRNRDYARA